MILNSSKIVISNIHLTNYSEVNKEICFQGVTISPSPETKFLGVIIDRLLVDIFILFFLSNSRLFLMRQLRNMGMNPSGLKLFYQIHIKSILTYAAPVWKFFE